jgi:hypothetical protein
MLSCDKILYDTNFFEIAHKFAHIKQILMCDVRNRRQQVIGMFHLILGDSNNLTKI